MDDKKLNSQNGGTNPQPTNPNTNKPESSIDILTQKAKEEKFEFGSAGHDDINKNLGSFGKTVVQAEQPAANEVKLDVDAKVVEKASQEKIDFERFAKTKRSEKTAKTKFGERVSIMLRSRKGFKATWIIEMVLMVIIIAVSATLIGCLTKQIGAAEGLIHTEGVQRCLKIGLVFSWISIFPCIIPIIYLITTWFIGINQVASSRLYHYMFWICAIISLICFIIGFGLLMVPVHAIVVY